MQSYNPYLPLWEYIPDGEPHVFGDRVYLYGSHDGFGGNKYCMNDYVCWSANVHDLKEWRYEGIIYRSARIQECRMVTDKSGHRMSQEARMEDTIYIIARTVTERQSV